MIKDFALNIFGRTITQVILAVAVTIGAGATAAATIWPNSEYTTAAIATETARDINRIPHTPVEYSFNGETREGLVRATAIAGTTIEINLDAEGNIADRSVSSALSRGFLVALFAGAWMFLLFWLTGEDMVKARRRMERGKLYSTTQ